MDELPHMIHQSQRCHVSGLDVYHSKEFKALCERFGIAWGLPTKTITLTLNVDELIVNHCYPGRVGEGDDPTADRLNTQVETTTLHNRRWKTFAPAARRDPITGNLVDWPAEPPTPQPS